MLRNPSVLAEEHADQHPPLGEVGGLEVEHDRHVGVNTGMFTAKDYKAGRTPVERSQTPGTWGQ
jgi:hypothetical protein